ncbi:hypothetical protein D3C72_88570 [compost metagenome]
MRQALRGFHVDAFARFFYQRQDVAHPEDTIGHTCRVERFQPIQFFGDTCKFDRLAGDVAYRQRGTATRIAVQFGQHDTGQRQCIAKSFGGVDRILPQHRIDHEQGFYRFDGGVQGFDFQHHRFVDTKATGGIDDQDVVVMTFGVIQCGQCDVDWLVAGLRREEVGTDLSGDGFQLADSGRTVNVSGNGQDFFLLLLAQVLRQLTDGGGFTGTLQTGHQDDGGRLGREIELGCFRPQICTHDGGQFTLYYADQCLARCKRTDDIFAHRFFFDAADKFAHGGQGDVGLEQGQTYFAQHFCSVSFRQARFSAHGFDGFG